MATRKKLATTVYLTHEQRAQLAALNARTRVPVAEYIRDGIDLILARHGMGELAEPVRKAG